MNRIHELDIARGIGIIGYVTFHLLIDLSMLHYFDIPSAVEAFFKAGGILFILISGICSTLGQHPIRRGSIVFGCGIAVHIASLIASYQLSFLVPVRFGILEFLGFCMLLSPLLNKLGSHAIPTISGMMIILGICLHSIPVSQNYLYPLGLMTPTFQSSDFWPIFPNLGFYLLGIYLGNTCYASQEPRFPSLQSRLPFLSFLGRHALPIYLIHQPLLALLIYLGMKWSQILL